ncbi:MAG: T9SS type A sorting domain-containing protein, partial [Hymenobacteraceae bacterium]|nr:T9SS type A sorting domain-containing protein [Hymenobacteraceae bacterium]
NQLESLVIAGNSSATLSSNSSLSTTKQVKVWNGSRLIVEGLLSNTGVLEVQDGATLKLNYAFTDPATQLFAGTEVCAPNSEIIVEKWHADKPLAGNYISVNSSGYLFGNLIINTNLASTWTLCPAGTTYLTSGDFVVQQTGSQPVTISSEGVSEVFFGKSVKIVAGNVRLQDAATATTTATIKENLQLDGGNLTLSQLISASATFALNVEGDVTIATLAQLTNNNTGSLSGSAINFSGKKQQMASIAPAVSTVPFVVKSGSSLQLQLPLSLNPATSANAGSLTVENGATLNFGTGATGVPNNITGNGYFTLASGGALIINSPDGIMATGATGNVQVRETRRSFHSQAIYRYAGTIPQQTGTGLLSTTSGKILIIDNPTTVTLTQSTGISNNTNISADGGRLEIRQGTFIAPEGADVLSSGKLVMTGNSTYRIFSLNTTVPQLTGGYSLAGGTIELAGNGSQTLRGSSAYTKVIVSGDNTSNSTFKTISTTTTISHTLEIKPNAVFDITNKTLNGDAGLVMTGGIFRTAKLTGTLPELTGNNAPYDLRGGTIELYGTGATQSQSIRGNFGGGQKITYFNLLIGAATANVSTGLANAVVGSSFDVSGTMRVVAPASIQISSNRSIGGSGNFVLEESATLFYGAAEGIKKAGTGITDGNIRVSGSRSFSEKANYGLIGALEMVTGDALPTRVNNLTIDKSAGAVTLTNPVEVTGILTLQNGLVHTGANELFLSADGASSLVASTPAAYVNGTLRRTMLSSGTYTFPVGTATQLHQLQLIPQNLSGNGYSNVAVKFVPGTGQATVSVLEKDVYLNSLVETGSWQIIPNAAPSAGTYTAMASISGFDGLADNKFGIVVKPETTTKGYAPLSEAEYTNGGGTLTDAGTAGRTIESGYALRTGMTTFGTMAIAKEVAPLPVTWSHFSAVFQKNTVEISWSTFCETDNSHFEVERSADGLIFEAIATVAAIPGKPEGLRQYRHTDYSPLTGISYYRIKQVDTNGEYSYTNVKAVNNSETEIRAVKVYPNPATDKAVVEVKLQQPETVLLQLLNLEGKVMKQQEVKLVSGVQLLQLELENLPAGTYLLRISTNTTQHIQKLVVQ